MNLAILAATRVLGLIIGVPVAVTLGLSSLAYLLSAGIPLVVIPQKIFAGMDSVMLLCIPNFVLPGNLMNGGGITGRIIRFVQVLAGWIRGGLADSNVASSMLFGGISGTAVAAFIGRAFTYRPGAMGRKGVEAALSVIRRERDSTMDPCGVNDIKDFGPGCLWSDDHGHAT